VEWEDTCTEPQVERVVPVYNTGLHTFLRDKFVVWASNGSNVEEIWNNFKNIVHESIECFVPHKTFRKNSDPEYYNKEIKQLDRVQKEAAIFAHHRNSPKGKLWRCVESYHAYVPSSKRTWGTRVEAYL